MPVFLPVHNSKWKHSEIISLLENTEIPYYYLVITDRTSKKICNTLDEGDYYLSTSASTMAFKQRAKIRGKFPFEPWPPTLSNPLDYDSQHTLIWHSYQVSFKHQFSFSAVHSILKFWLAAEFFPPPPNPVWSLQVAPHAVTRALTQSLLSKLIYTVLNCPRRVYVIRVIITPVSGASTCD